ncbi:hypothetical protein D3C83_239300 [compost metagenome]
MIRGVSGTGRTIWACLGLSPLVTVQVLTWLLLVGTQAVSTIIPFSVHRTYGVPSRRSSPTRPGTMLGT